MAIKRSIEDIEFEKTIAMANYLNHYYLSTTSYSGSAGSVSIGTDRVYECKTCNRQFPSFQALGGHRASHKKPKMSIGEDDADHNIMDESNARKPKIHACSICGLKFPIGQALGGHMRRHRGPISGSSSHMTLSLIEASLNSHNNGDKSSDLTKSTMNISGDHDHHRSVICLDLNLTPLENGLLEFGKLAQIDVC